MHKSLFQPASPRRVRRPPGGRTTRVVQDFTVVALLMQAMACTNGVGTGEVSTGLSADSDAAGVIDLPVSFNVYNVNGSKVPCLSDSAAYTVRGHLVAPAAALAPGQGDGAATLYLHGSGNGEQIDFRSTVPGQNWAVEMAKLGQVSVTIDRLGFGASGLPDGLMVCVGSQADVVHQVVAALRSGGYAIAGGVAPRFEKVVLAAISFGGGEAAVEAYSFKDVDALIQLSTAFDQGLSPAATLDLATNPNGSLQTCPRGGDPKYPDGSGPGNYTYVVKDRTDLLFYNAEPAAVETFVRGWEREPCGEGASLAAMLAADRLYLGDITIPVLLVFADHDALFPPPDGEREKALYTGSQDVTLIQVANTGHGLPLERTAPIMRAALADWLSARGF